MYIHPTCRTHGIKAVGVQCKKQNNKISMENSIYEGIGNCMSCIFMLYMLLYMPMMSIISENVRKEAMHKCLNTSKCISLC